jgi:hypothetical protein
MAPALIVASVAGMGFGAPCSAAATAAVSAERAAITLDDQNATIKAPSTRMPAALLEGQHM